MTPISRATLDKLATFDTPTLCNIIELFDVRSRSAGYLDGRIQAAFADLPPMVGFAATATFRSAAPPSSGDTLGRLAEQVERFAALDGPAVVVFQDLDQPSAAATFGDVMCSTYRAFGAVGLITSGAGRDLDQVRALEFPVFTNGTICSHGYTHIPDLGCPVHVGGVTIYPNDLLHGDRNGVTTVPRAIAAEAADIGADFVAAERIVLEVVQAGGCTPAQLRDALRATQDAIARLRQQVGRKSAVGS